MAKKLLLGLICLLFICAACIPVIAAEQVKKSETKKIDYGKIGDFKTFFSTLKQVAKEKNTVAFKQMLADSFTYTLGYDPALKPDEKPTHDSALRYMEKYGMWPKLNAILEKGYAPPAHEGFIHFVSPPAFGRKGDPNYLGPRAGFRKIDGYWKIQFLIEGGD